MLRQPGSIARAVLLSPMVPFEPSAPVRLNDTRVFIGAGRSDPIVPVAQVERLKTILEDAGAEVAVHLHPGGHTITNDEFQAAQKWISN
jgi:predicted esterase